MNDGRHYTRIEGNAIVVFDVESGQKTDTFTGRQRTIKGLPAFRGQISRYSFSGDEAYIILEEETESIYRTFKQRQNLCL